MNRLVLSLCAALLPACVLAQQGEPALPLKEGRFMVGGCDRFNESGSYIGIGVYKDGPHRGRQFIVPQAEGQQGFCRLTKVGVMGAVTGGVAECDNGARTNPVPTGTYRFNFSVHSPHSFTSLGKRYDWCPSRR